MKTKELIYIVLDLCKVASDDAYFTEEHVEWLLNKNRAFLLKREEERLKEQNSEENKQTICVDLELTTAFCNDDCSDTFLKSIQEIPDLISTSTPSFSTMDYFQSNICFIPFEKMKYVNYNKFLRNIIYASIGPDNHAYLKSSNPMFENLSRIKINGVFDDFEKAAELACYSDGSAMECDSFEMEFPIDSYLVPELIDRVLREMLGGVYRPKDTSNSASDDLSYIANFIRNYVKKPLQQQLDRAD